MHACCRLAARLGKPRLRVPTDGAIGERRVVQVTFRADWPMRVWVFSFLLAICAGCSLTSHNKISNMNPQQITAASDAELCGRDATGSLVGQERERRGLGDCSPAHLRCRAQGLEMGTPAYFRCYEQASREELHQTTTAPR
jgi:hypothetical protein